MLVLSRKKNETVEILGGRITVRVLEVRGNQVRLGFDAARDDDIHRGEVADAIRAKFADMKLAGDAA